MEKEKINLIVEKEIGLRMDLFMSMNINSLSRSEVKTAINNGDVQVNGVVEYRPHYKVRKGDAVTLLRSPQINNSDSGIKPVKMDLDVIYEDKDLIIINKPAGLVTHPATGHTEDTLMNGLLYRFYEMSNVGDKIRSGLIHRLDKDTSGLILVGKTNLGLWHYSKMFAEKQIQKTYIVVVKGDIRPKFKDKSEITIRSIHGRNKLNRKKFASQKNYDGKMAVTRFKLISFKEIDGQGYSALFAFPETGRTHQIRVHLSEAGFPVLGDQIYGKNEYSRLMLHAYKIQLTMLNGKTATFKANLPKEFKKFTDEHTLEIQN